MDKFFLSLDKIILSMQMDEAFVFKSVLTGCGGQEYKKFWKKKKMAH